MLEVLRDRGDLMVFGRAGFAMISPGAA